MPDPVACINLSERHERRMLATAAAHDADVPAVVISGFLGSGKTTLVQHLLRNRGDVRVAVVVNEVSSIDVDSGLLGASATNAALGVATAELAGGCVCCTKQGELREALERIRSPPAGVPRPDSLVLETSGVADPEALASVLRSCGYRFDMLVAVVDAEAAADVLHLPVAKRQVELADLVVVNKCDLASLIELASVEDLVLKISPGVRCMRARFGQVPLPAVLDVEAARPPLHTQQPADAAASAAAAWATAGGFLSHEARLSGGPAYRMAQPPGTGGRQRRRLDMVTDMAEAATPRSKMARREREASSAADDRADGMEGGGAGRSGARAPHAHLHSGFHTCSVVLDAAPLPLAHLQAFVSGELLRCRGLFRAKGTVWVLEARRERFVLHLSGRRRTECVSDGAWDSPPRTQLVFIGSDSDALTALACSLQAAADACMGGKPGAALAASPLQARRASAAAELLGSDKRLEVLQPRMHSGMDSGTHSGMHSGTRREAGSASERQARGNATPGDIPACPPAELVPLSGEPAAAAAPSMLELTVVSAPLHGIVGAEVNAALMRVVNAAGELCLFGVRPPGSSISACGTVRRTDRVASLLLGVPALEVGTSPGTPPCTPDTLPGAGGCVDDGRSSDAWLDMVARLLHVHGEPVLRHAFQHAHNCRCDVPYVVNKGG